MMSSTSFSDRNSEIRMENPWKFGDFHIEIPMDLHVLPLHWSNFPEGDQAFNRTLLLVVELVVFLGGLYQKAFIGVFHSQPLVAFKLFFNHNLSISTQSLNLDEFHLRRGYLTLPFMGCKMRIWWEILGYWYGHGYLTTSRDSGVSVTFSDDLTNGPMGAARCPLFRQTQSGEIVFFSKGTLW